MTDELALKLKEAGFPMPYTFEEMKGTLRYDGDTKEYVYKPGLSALIDACGENVMLLKEKIECTAGVPFKGIVTHGENLETAAANLWLVLNEK